MLIFDAHLDLAWNAIDWKRDLDQSIERIRADEAGMTELGRGTNTVSFPEMRRGGVGICVATILARLHRPGNPMFGYATPESCYAVGQGQMAYYRAMERAGRLVILRRGRDLATHAARWQADPERTPIGIILSMEGADPVLDPENIRDWWEAGLRAIGLTHYGKNRYGGGTQCPDGLAPEAYPLLEHIEKLGMALDLTHLSDRAFVETLDRFGGRILASHQNARRFVDDGRQFSDEQLRAVIDRNGVIGAALDAWMLQPGWVRGVTKPQVTCERVVDNIEHVCQLAGNARHAAIGSDLDGGFGAEQTPADVNTIADLVRLEDLLSNRGFSGGDIENILHGNWLRFFGEVLPA